MAGAPLQARRSERITLPPHATAAEAFQAVARNALGQIAANAQVLRADPGAEAVHQLRVAARRLRSALSTFKTLISDPGHAAVKADLKWLAGGLNDARNLDVFADSVAAQGWDLQAQPDGFEALSAARDCRQRTLPGPDDRRHRLGRDRRMAGDGA